MCDVQCTKTNVNGCDALVSIISTKTFQCATMNIVQRKIGRSGV